MIYLKNVFAVICLIIQSSCKTNDSYKKTLACGMNNIKWAKQMEVWYGAENVDHVISHYKFDPGSPVTWTTIAYLYGRYELYMKIEVNVDYGNSVITGFEGDPKFYLFEKKSIDFLPTGQLSAIDEDSKNVPKIDTKIWKNLEAVNGDLGILPGIEKSKPLVNFPEWRKASGHVLNAR